MPMEDCSAKLFGLRGGIVEPPGGELPELLGIDVIGSRRAIVHTAKSHNFPGEGEMDMLWPSLVVVTPLTAAPSGHLCMVIDDFENLTKKGGVPDATLQLHTHQTQEAVASPPKSNL